MTESLLNDGITSIFSQVDTGVIGAAAVAGVQQLTAAMERYCSELELFNAAYDLVGADTREDIIVRHILDSLAAVPLFQQLVAQQSSYGPVVIADAGSGGGLPGIPLAAAFPGVQFELLERMAKRCAFLENCALMMNLSNVTVINKEIERCPRGRYSIVTFRAFRPLDVKMTRSLLSLRKQTGIIAAYKAKQAKIREEMSAITALAADYRMEPLTVPYLPGSERHMVLF